MKAKLPPFPQKFTSSYCYSRYAVIVRRSAHLEMHAGLKKKEKRVWSKFHDCMT